MEEAKETVVAVLPDTKGKEGEEFVSDGNGWIDKVQNFEITCDEDYEAAGNFGREIKRRTSDVVEFFKPLKTAAHQAHKQICDREKEVLKPFSDAEKIIKKSMSDYLAEQERKRKEQEEQMKQLAQKQIDESLEKAAELEAEGKGDEAERMIENAITAENFQNSGMAVPPQSAPSVKGVSTTTTYEIVSVDSELVPVNVAGVEIRPVDLAAVKRLIKASKGTIKIDGIEYKAVQSVSLRK